MAQRLAGHLRAVAGVRLMFPVQANAVFAEIPADVQERLRSKGWRFYTFLGETGCRLMCAWDMTTERVDQFADDLRRAGQ
jgi:threonine aldolase